MTTTSPPDDDRRLTTLLAVVGGVLVGLTLILVVILLSSGDDDGTAGSTTSTDATTTTAATSTTAPTTTTAPSTTTTLATTTTTAPTTTTTTATTTTTEPFDGDTGDKGAPAVSGNPGPLTDIRLGEHAGFTRIVFDFEGSGEHRWSAGYVPVLIQDGSGEPCSVDGSDLLEVRLEPASAYAEATYDGPNRFSPNFDSSVVEVRICTDFEANLQIGIGVDGEKPFDAFVYQDPLRLVIDIAD